MAGNFWGNPGANSQVMANTQQANGSSAIVFINDDSVAMNYPIAPGYTVALINANDPSDGKMFIRSTEANGMPKAARVFSIKEITPQAQNADSVSQKDFEALNQRVSVLGNQLSQIISALSQSAPPPPTTTAKTKGDKKA